MKVFLVDAKVKDNIMNHLGGRILKLIKNNLRSFPIIFKIKQLKEGQILFLTIKRFYLSQTQRSKEK